MTARIHPRRAGFTVLEVLTALVVLGVLVAIAIPSWRTHELRMRRAEAVAALTGIQKAQDLHFGKEARYADAAQLGRKGESDLGLYRIELRVSDDGLAYTASARASGAADDSRCVEFSIDHNGLRRALNAAGEDRTADCWR